MTKVTVSCYLGICMETYYTTENFHIFIAVLAFLSASAVLAILPVFRRLPRLLKGSVWSLIASAAAAALSRVCPYPIAAAILRIAGISTGAAGVLAGVLSSVRFVFGRSPKKGFGAFAEPDRVVTNFLAGRYLVIDPLGGILAGTVDCLDCAATESNRDFADFVGGLFRDFPDTKENRNLRESFRRLNTAEGNLKSGDRFLRCTLSPLGESGVEGFLFFVQDFSEEHRLLRQRDEREKLMTQRLEQIRIQGEAEAQALRTREASRVAERYTGIISEGIEKLTEEIDFSTSGGRSLSVGIRNALNLAERTMENLRAAVHGISSGEGANG